jgi:hypothetical protein
MRRAFFICPASCGTSEGGIDSACSGIGTATALVWKLTRVEQSLREAIARSRDEIEANHAVEARI